MDRLLRWMSGSNAMMHRQIGAARIGSFAKLKVALWFWHFSMPGPNI